MASDFVTYAIFDSTTDEFKKYKHLDGSVRLEYVRRPKKSDPERFYIANTIAFEQTTSGLMARWSSVDISYYLNDLYNNDLEYISLIDSINTKYWDLKLIKYDGSPIGNSFRCIKGEALYFIIFTGYYYNNAHDWNDFIQNKLKRIEVYPDKP